MSNCENPQHGFWNAKLSVQKDKIENSRLAENSKNLNCGSGCRLKRKDVCNIHTRTLYGYIEWYNSYLSTNKKQWCIIMCKKKSHRCGALFDFPTSWIDSRFFWITDTYGISRNIDTVSWITHRQTCFWFPPAFLLSFAVHKCGWTNSIVNGVSLCGYRVVSRPTRWCSLLWAS